MSSKITIAIFEDNPATSMGLKSYLESLSTFQFEILFVAESQESFLLDYKKHNPDWVLMDVIAAEIWGLELFTKLFEEHPKANVIAYSNVRNIRVVQSLLGMGVAGFVSKADPLTELEVAFNSILLDRKTYVPSTMSSFVLSKRLPLVLTGKEKQILTRLIEGESSKEIANSMFVSTNTVDFHKKNLFTKFEVNNIASLVSEAISQGFSRGTHH